MNCIFFRHIKQKSDRLTSNPLPLHFTLLKSEPLLQLFVYRFHVDMLEYDSFLVRYSLCCDVFR